MEANAATTIRLCGELAVEMDGRRLESALPSRQGRLVFAYLVLNRGRAVSRDEVIDALWPARVPASPERLLTELLSRLRRALPVGVLEGRSQLSLRLAPDAWVDVEVAAAAVARAQSALDARRAGEAIAVARAALEILERPLLPELDRPWVDERRRELADVVPMLLELLGRAALAAGGAELATGEAAARRLIEREPFRESAHALLMEILAARGNVAQGLRVYHTLRTLLRDELGTVPAAGVRELGERLLREGRAPSEGLPPPASLREDHVFVGRDEELATIGGALRDGTARVVLVAGEAGIGKTSLVARAARAADMTVLYGRCDEEPLMPYQPFAEALRDLVARAPGLVRDRAVAPHRAALARLLPGLADAVRANGGENRYRLFDAVTAVLDSVGDPVLFVLDDLQWADAPTVLMLRYVVRHVREPLVVLATTREADAGGSVGALALDLRRDDALVRLRLTGLDLPATRQLAAAHAPAVPDAELVRRMHERTGGNPFFLEQLLHAGPDTRVPERVHELITHRVERLGPAAGETLRLAATIGIEFELGLLEQLTGDREAVVTAMDAALAAGLVVESGGAPGHFAFVHALARDAIYHGMSATRRAALHQRVAHALDQWPGTGRSTEVAHHFVQAGPLAPAGKVRDALVAAARSAAAALAFETAAAHMRHALELPEGLKPRAEFELLLELADAHQRAGDRDAAREVLLRAIALARAVGDADALGRAALGYGAGFSWYGFSYNTDPALTALLEEALASRGEDDGVRVRLLARLALERYYAARYHDASALGAEAVARADRLADPEIQVLARYSALFPLDGPDDVLRLEQAASGILAHPGIDEELAFRARIFRLRARLQLADIAAADADIADCERAAEQLRQPLYGWQAGVLRAMRALMRGAVDEGEREAQAAFATGVEAGQPDEAQFVLAPQLLTVASLRGRLLDFEAPLRTYAESLPIMEPRIEATLSWVLAEGGRPDEARRWLSRAMERDPARLPRHSLWLITVAMLAEATALLGAPAHAERLLPLLSPYFDRCLVTGAGAAYAGSVSYYLGRLATVLRRWDQGDRWFQRAVDVERGMGALPAMIRAQLGWATLLAGRDDAGDRARASELTGAALASARELGLNTITARAGAAEATTDRPGAASP